MENNLEEFHHQNDVFSQFQASESTNKVLEALKMQLTLDKQEEQESNSAWNNLSAAAKCPRVDKDKMQIKLDIAQHLVDESDFNFLKMHLLNCISDNICTLGNHLNVSSQLSDKAMINLKQAYPRSNFHDASFQILRTKAQKAVFRYQKPKAPIK
jgi:DsbC/DsbD-like thiol-disulfide interchange protein